jgi:hypothetical protein
MKEGLEAICFSEASVNFHRTTWCYIPEDKTVPVAIFNIVPIFVLRWETQTFFLILVREAVGTAATPGLLCQPRVIMKMIVEKQME